MALIMGPDNFTATLNHDLYEGIWDGRVGVGVNLKFKAEPTCGKFYMAQSVDLEGGVTHYQP